LRELSDEQRQFIQPLLPPKARTGAEAAYDAREAGRHLRRRAVRPAYLRTQRAAVGPGVVGPIAFAPPPTG
jgi:hypothetical protein